MGVEATAPAAAVREGELRTVGIVMNGVTGRMGTNQHLIRSILAIRRQGGVAGPRGQTIWPEPVLVGRSEAKLRALAGRHGLERWSTDLDEALADPSCEVYFDSAATNARADGMERAIAAGKHVYCEKPSASDLDSALRLARLAQEAGVKHGVVQDKLFLPGLRKLRRLVDSGFFGRILSVRGEFGYWVFEGPEPPAQRPSWNYRAEDGGGILADMLPHWRYVLDDLFGAVRTVYTLGAIHVPERVDEAGRVYECTAEDAAYATFQLEGGIVAQLNSSWSVRVNRDELVEFQVDGTDGSAVAGLRGCRVQPRDATPRALWNPDIADANDYRHGWLELPNQTDYDNGFKLQWEMFLRHVAGDEPFAWDLLEGAKGIQLAELAERSWKERRMLEVPELSP
ncbi:MAG: Gfo/Idh/MocA family oxidoreductase [Thermoleophilaceae bacterium]